MLNFLRDLFHFEFPEDGGGGEPPADIPGLGPHPGGFEPEAPAGEPAWQGPSQEEWAETQNALAYFNQQLQPAEPLPAAGEQQSFPQIDPFADNFGEQLSQFMQQQFQQHLSPFQEWVQHQQLGEAEDRATDILDDIVSREGEFLVQDGAYDQIRSRANVFLNEETQKYGFGPQAAEAALNRAAKEQRSYEKAVGEKAIAKHLNQIRTLSGAPGEPGSAYTQGAQQRVTQDFRQGAGSLYDRLTNAGR